jgi:hypothetical protein
MILPAVLCEAVSLVAWGGVSYAGVMPSLIGT